MKDKMMEEFLQFTEGVRPDFHEPDEQGIRLVDVVGTQLDNAMGERLSEEAIRNGYQECTIILSRDGTKSIFLNLATVLGWARLWAAHEAKILDE
jgi:hypothetical protein